MEKSEIINLISCGTLPGEILLHSTESPLAHFINNLSLSERAYLSYCMFGFSLETRDYSILRYALEQNVKENVDVIMLKLKECVKDLIQKKEIEIIYDIGAGHAAWADCLSVLFPKAEVILVDRYKIEQNLYTQHSTDFADFLKGFEGNSSILFLI